MEKLPKQWAHWCRQMNLRKPSNRWGTYRNIRQWDCMKGKGRHWRVNNKDMFQIGEPYEQFDRWANSYVAETTIPRTYKEFQAAVDYLLVQPYKPWPRVISNEKFV